ncbi:hypothetical protein H0E87_020191, partial [Populus deltoides]
SRGGGPRRHQFATTDETKKICLGWDVARMGLGTPTCFPDGSERLPDGPGQIGIPKG